MFWRSSSNIERNFTWQEIGHFLSVICLIQKSWSLLVEYNHKWQRIFLSKLISHIGVALSSNWRWYILEMSSNISEILHWAWKSVLIYVTTASIFHYIHIPSFTICIIMSCLCQSTGLYSEHLKDEHFVWIIFIASFIIHHQIS